MVKSLSDELIEQFSGSVSVSMVLLSVLTAFIISIGIVYIYRKTYSGVVYSKNTSLTIIMLSLVTALIIRTINSNLSLSLGMVGALSIVRFRTAIKEPLDTAFMFWAITAGIMSGAGLYLIALAGSLTLGILFYVVYLVNIKAKSQYLLVLNYKLAEEEEVGKILETIKEKKLKTRTLSTKDVVEVTYEVTLDDETITNQFKELKGVNSVSLISYKNEVGM